MKDADIILRNLERTKHGLPITKRAKDSYIKGIQLQRCYQAHWDEIRDIFSEYKIDMRHQSPIITIQTLKEVEMAKEITEKIKHNKEIRELAEDVSYPLRNVYPSPSISKDDLIDGTIFIVILRLIPQISLELGKKALSSFFNNGNTNKYLSDLFKSHGTIIETQKDFEETVKKILTENFK
jgi:hypothetical protein